MDRETWVLIAAVGQCLLQLASWLVPSEQVRRFLRKSLPWSFGVAVLAILLYGMWHFGWLKWLSVPIITPLWVIILGGVSAVGLSAGAGLLFARWATKGRRAAAKQLPPNPFSAHGVLWEYGKDGPHLPPLCPKCWMGMRHQSRFQHIRDGQELRLHVWTCRECGYSWMWDDAAGGDLEEDLAERLLAEIRKARREPE